MGAVLPPQPAISWQRNLWVLWVAEVLTILGFSMCYPFLPFYLEKKLLPHDPFAVLDQRGVGELVRIGIERGRHTVPGLKVGICGEHGGEPSSVEFCHRVGMTYVSCSPYMVPVAWLASAHAEVNEPRQLQPKASRIMHGEVQPKASRQWLGEVQPKASRADKKRSHVSSAQRGKKR